MKRRAGRRVPRPRWRDDAPRLRVRLASEWSQGHASSTHPELGARSRLVHILWLEGPPETDNAAVGHEQPGDSSGLAGAISGGSPRTARGRSN
ncbi:MAG: hypothetical protein ABW217_15445 [Polyangiaceae bacterium]